MRVRVLLVAAVTAAMPVVWVIASAMRPALVPPPAVPPPPILSCADVMPGDRYTPPDLETAINWQLRCVKGLRDLIRSFDEAKFVQQAWRGGNPNGWLSVRNSRFWRWFQDRGLMYTDDIYAVFLSAAWHHVRGLEFDLDSRVRCYQAWNRITQRRLEKSGGRLVEWPTFGCTDDAEVERGRSLWNVD